MVSKSQSKKDNDIPQAELSMPPLSELAKAHSKRDPTYKPEKVISVEEIEGMTLFELGHVADTVIHGLKRKGKKKGRKGISKENDAPVKDMLRGEASFPDGKLAEENVVLGFNSTQSWLYDLWKRGHPLPELDNNEHRIEVGVPIRTKTLHSLEGLKYLYQRDDLDVENKYWFSSKHRELHPLLNAATKVARRKQLCSDLSMIATNEDKEEYVAETALLIALQDAHASVSSNINKLNSAIEKLHTKRWDLLSRQNNTNGKRKKNKNKKKTKKKASSIDDIAPSPDDITNDLLAMKI
ncbi:hypothetical protein TRICI_004297 [Trichomonascus ciferrii]|uniref:Uncharacterized protein n=1 Tax=Trichomonascus ciferrii TaxID=44093 RepID=A0A642V187_9ASCO|nr:hypothetical protein TRICI_004297 [Trichomonascus ciferrii]